MSRKTYSPQDVADACGIPRRMVARYLNIVHPKRAGYVWTRFTEDEYQSAITELQECIAIRPKQPLRALVQKRALLLKNSSTER